MNRASLLIAAIAIASVSQASVLSVWPSQPTTQDALLLEIRGAPPCATVALDAAYFAGDGVIRVPFDDGNRVLCTAPNPCPLVVPLGRLPAGNYTIEFVPDRPSLVSGTAVDVTVYQSVWPGEGRNSYRRRLSQDCAG